MPLPDHIQTSAAAIYGHAVALEHGKKKPHEESDDAPSPSPLTGSWKHATDSERAAFLKASRFLASWANRTDLDTLDRDAAAEALAGALSDTILHGTGFDYRGAVEVFVAVQQSLR